MAAKKRDVWHRKRARRQTKHLPAFMGKTPGSTRGRRAAKAAAGLHDSRGRSKKKIADATEDPRRAHQKDVTVVLARAPPLRAEECCAPVPLKWCHLGPPLLAARVREMFGRPLLYYDMPAASTTPSFSSCGLGRSDEEALSWLFPAVHNGEWFATPWDFMNHYKSVSHQLLCDGAPLFPLVMSLSRRGRTLRQRTQAEVMAETEVAITRLPGADDGAAHTVSDEDGGGLRWEQWQDVYHWWFMHIHAAVVQFGLREWWPQVSTLEGGVASTTALRLVGEMWCGCRVFQAAVSASVAQHLASFSGVQPYAASEAVTLITRAVRDVYMRMPRVAAAAAAPLFSSSASGGNVATCSPNAPVEHFAPLDAEAHNAAATAHPLVDIDGDGDGGAGEVVTLTVREEEALRALSQHLAAAVTDTLQRERGIQPIVPARQKVQLPTTLLFFPSHVAAGDGTTDGAGMYEEHIMALVLWLFLCDAAAHTPTSEWTDRQTESIKHVHCLTDHI